MKNTILYSSITSDALSDSQSERAFITRAQLLGYQAIKFAGWDNTDLSGPRKSEARENRKRINAVLDSRRFADAYMLVLQTVGHADPQPMEDDDATTIVRADLGDNGSDL